jgi:hypothetical protein
MFTSTSNIGSPDLISSCIDLSSNPSSKTNNTDLDLPDVVTHTSFARRLVLDDAVQLLEHILIALENIYNDNRGPNSAVPGVLDNVLTTSNYTIFVKIMTSITENWAKCNRLIAKPVLEVVQERLQEVEQNSLNCINKNRCQRNMTCEDRNKSECLKHAIVYLDVRELSGIELQDLLSKPVELIGEFSKETEYDIVMKHIEKENTDDTRS